LAAGAGAGAALEVTFGDGSGFEGAEFDVFPPLEGGMYLAYIISRTIAAPDFAMEGPQSLQIPKFLDGLRSYRGSAGLHR
jgi:hypothetical protein